MKNARREEGRAKKQEHSNPDPDSKRPRAQLQVPVVLRHPWKRRKLIVPNSVDEGGEQNLDAYQNHGLSCDFWLDRVTAPRPPNGFPRRPWPSSQVLMSTMTTTNSDFSLGFVAHKSPFFQAFYKSIGMTVPGSTPVVDHPHGKLGLVSAPSSADANHDLEIITEDIDNPSFSTLSPAQHRRYLKLVQQTERRTPSERSHWQQLRALVPVEQSQFKNAVHKYWACHREDRLLWGLSSASSSSSGSCRAFYQWACAENRRHNDSLLGRPLPVEAVVQGEGREGGHIHPSLVFGKCLQVLSLRAIQDTNPLPDVTSFDMKVLVVVSGNDKTKKNPPILSVLPPVGTRIQAPAASTSFFPETRRLHDDRNAMQLAAQYQADVLTSEETLETLLSIPGDGGATTRWMILATNCCCCCCATETFCSTATTSTTAAGDEDCNNHKHVIVLEAPLAQAYTTPRECLTRGIQEGLYQHAAAAAAAEATIHRTQDDDGSAVPMLPQQEYTYTLWTLPVTSAGGTARRRSLRVLIRSMVRLLWNSKTGSESSSSITESASSAPLKIRAHVEYFPERGQEILSRYERSLWILDQLLWQQPQQQPIPIVTKLCRVDGRTGTILEWQETSVAHAFAADEGGEGDNPMQGFAQLMQFFQAVSKIDFRGGGSSTSSLFEKSNSSTATPFQTQNCRLLCLPSRERASSEGNIMISLSDLHSVSVHAPYEQTKTTTTTTQTPDFTVNLEPLLQNADSVLLSAKAIQECHRPWKWNVPDRIPYTFPTGTSTTPTSSK